GHRARGYRLLEEVVGVERLALERDEEVALRDGPRVGPDAHNRRFATRKDVRRRPDPRPRRLAGPHAPQRIGNAGQRPEPAGSHRPALAFGPDGRGFRIAMISPTISFSSKCSFSVPRTW